MPVSNAFYYLSADRDDIYFTRELIRVDFEKRLYLMLKNKGYENVYFFENANGNEIDIYCETVSDAEECLKKVKVGVFGKIPDIKQDATNKNGRTRHRIRLSDKLVKNTIENMIISKENDKYAFVIPASIFKRIYSTSYDRRDFVSFLQKNRYAKGTSFFILGDWNQKDEFSDLSGIEYILWEPYEKKQISRLLERVNIKINHFEEKNRMDKIRTELIDALNRGERLPVLDKKVDNKEELFELLIRGDNIKRLCQS